MTTYTLQQVRDHCSHWLPWALPTLNAAIASEAELRAENERMRTEWNADREHWHAVALSKERRIAELERELGAYKTAMDWWRINQTDPHIPALMERRVAELLAAPAAPTQNYRPAGFVKPDNDRQVFFYEQDFYVLSNFSAFNVEHNGQVFETSEAAYHWLKFPEAPEVQLAILHARSAHDAFKIAEVHKHLRRHDWDEVKASYMLEILREKVEQHEYVRRKLLATGDRELIEDSWRDDYWGWGPNRDGKNMLGKLWMRVRSELRTAHAAAQEVTK